MAAINKSGSCEFGIIGLGEMERGVAANIAQNGFWVAGFGKTHMNHQVKLTDN